MALASGQRSLIEEERHRQEALGGQRGSPRPRSCPSWQGMHTAGAFQP